MSKTIEIRHYQNRDDWNQLIAQIPAANFLQSFEWSEFQAAIGSQTWPLVVVEDDRPVGVFLTVKEEAKRGTYLTVAGGPVFVPEVEGQPGQHRYLQAVVDYLRNLAKQNGAVFVRVRPQLLDSDEVRQLYSTLGFKVAPMHLTADLTLQLDLAKSEDELLADMRKNTRYEVRKAERDGIRVETSADPADIKEFHKHQLELAEKHGFVPFSYEFLYEQFRIFAAQNQALLFHSFQEDRLLASAFIIFYNREAVYHYGISTPHNQKLPGSYACQWAAIQEAKARDCTRYNFWGIAPEDNPEHRFAGVSLFKRGFGGEEVAYLPAHDLPTSPLYTVTNVFENLRRKARGL